jgi:hypothetical protein
MSRRAFVFGILLGVIALGATGGCGDPLNRQEVTGDVTLKGQPIEDGVINFAPVDGQGTGDGAQILKGKYKISREKGLSPGKYRVSIWAGNGLSGEGDASPDAPKAGFRPAKERVPPEYNDHSQVFRDVVKGGQNKFDFNIP